MTVHTTGYSGEQPAIMRYILIHPLISDRAAFKQKNGFLFATALTNTVANTVTVNRKIYRKMLKSDNTDGNCIGGTRVFFIFVIGCADRQLQQNRTE